MFTKLKVLFTHRCTESVAWEPIVRHWTFGRTRFWWPSACREYAHYFHVT